MLCLCLQQKRERCVGIVDKEFYLGELKGFFLLFYVYKNVFLEGVLLFELKYSFFFVLTVVYNIIREMTSGI